MDKSEAADAPRDEWYMYVRSKLTTHAQNIPGAAAEANPDIIHVSSIRPAFALRPSVYISPTRRDYAQVDSTSWGGRVERKRKREREIGLPLSRCSAAEMQTEGKTESQTCQK